MIDKCDGRLDLFFGHKHRLEFDLVELGRVLEHSGVSAVANVVDDSRGCSDDLGVHATRTGKGLLGKALAPLEFTLAVQ